jgi:t-SNARE complex subunit (syntaxin)
MKRLLGLASPSFYVSENRALTSLGVFLGNNYIQAMRDIKATQQTIKRVTEARKRELKQIFTAAAKRVYFGQENFAKQWFKFVYFEHF